MMERRRVWSVAVAGAMLMVLLGSTIGTQTAAAGSKAPARSSAPNDPETWSPQPRLKIPEDRYAMAGGCYRVRAAEADSVVRDGDGFATTGTSEAAEPFHFQATALGRYLLFGSAEGFVAASEEIGREGDVVSAPKPSNRADWKINQKKNGAFLITLPKTDQALAVDANNKLVLKGPDKGSAFLFRRTTGCATFPEIEVNVDGPVPGGQNTYQEVRGFLDAHLHGMAFEFLGGRARCGRPWHRFGAAHALVDCPDHEPNGYGAVLEKLVSKDDMTEGHNTNGWPTFEGWPRYGSLTHEQAYYKWIERAWRGGLRMFVNLLVDNNQLCKIYPLKKNSCNEMDGVRLQAKRIHQLRDYIDAQSGGPGEGWFRIVKNPFRARRVISNGKLAVVLGIEVSVPLNCGLTLDQPRCNLEKINEGLDEVYDLGVRQMELVNKFDNAFSGVAGDEGTTGVVVNGGNFLETGRFWQMETCDEHAGHAHDKHQINWHDESGSPDEFSGRDSLAGGIFGLFGSSGAAPVYSEGPHCNKLGLSELGEKMIRGLAKRGMIFDPDHMSAKAQKQALDLIEKLGYSGVISSHGWSNSTIYPRIYKAGGVITPYAGGSEGFVAEWRTHKRWADDRFTFGFGYGSDVNGFGSQGGPRGADVPNPVTYPFEGFGGVTVDQQQSGTRTYDVNTDGVAHYGLYPDWIEDLEKQAGPKIVRDMAMGPEAYLQMWERAIGIAPDSCRPDVPNLRNARMESLSKGMSATRVLKRLGQPSRREGSSFRYCLTKGRKATLEFTDAGRLSDWRVR